MKYNEVQELLRIIAGIDRRQFPEDAAGAWYEILRHTEYEDAKAAVLEYFSTSADELPTLIPGRVRSGAARIRHVRTSAERKALTAAPPAQTPQEAAESARLRAEAQAAIRAATAAAVARVRERDPSLKPYRHRRGALTRTA
jgi:hypothetical protein